MSTRGRNRRGEGETSASTGGLDLAHYVAKDASATVDLFKAQMDKNPAEVASRIYRKQLMVENMLRSTAADAAKGILTRIVPEPKAVWQFVYRGLEWLYRLYQLTVLVFAGMEQGFKWNQGPYDWRTYMLVLGCVQAVWWLFHSMALVFGYMNERQAFIEFHGRYVDTEMTVLQRSTETVALTGAVAEELSSMKHQMKGGSTRGSTASVSLVVHSGADTYRRNLANFRAALASDGMTDLEYRNEQGERVVDTPKMPCPNLPSSRFGFIYESMVTTFVLLPLIYLHVQIVDHGTTFDTYGLYRNFRVYVWLVFGALLLNNLIAFFDMAKLIDATWDFYDAHKEACVQLKLSMADEFVNFPDMSAVQALSNLLSNFVITPGALVLLTHHLQVLSIWDPTNNASINYHQFMVIEFVAWVVVLSAAFLGFVGMWLTWNNKCAYRVMMHNTLYWLALGFWLWTVWWFMREDFIAGHDSLLTTMELYVYEDYLWAASLAYAFHLYNTMFDKMRNWFNWDFQLTFAPFAYGL